VHSMGPYRRAHTHSQTDAPRVYPRSFDCQAVIYVILRSFHSQSYFFWNHMIMFKLIKRLHSSNSPMVHRFVTELLSTSPIPCMFCITDTGFR